MNSYEIFEELQEIYFKNVEHSGRRQQAVLVSTDIALAIQNHCKSSSGLRLIRHGFESRADGSRTGKTQMKQRKLTGRPMQRETMWTENRAENRYK